jgi:hypothetical protein
MPSRRISSPIDVTSSCRFVSAVAFRPQEYADRRPAQPVASRQPYGLGVTADDGVDAGIVEQESERPSRRNTVMAGQAFVKADWKRFAPTKAVKRKKPGWTQ